MVSTRLIISTLCVPSALADVPFTNGRSPWNYPLDFYHTTMASVDIIWSLQQVFTAAEAEIAEKEPELKGRTQGFADKWLKLFGLTTGIMGLGKDLAAGWGQVYGRKLIKKFNSLVTDAEKFHGSLLHLRSDDKKLIRVKRVREIRKFAEKLTKLFIKDRPLYVAVNEFNELFKHDLIADEIMVQVQKSDLTRRVIDRFASSEFMAHMMRKEEEREKDEREKEEL